jgi:hypothetical protein
VPSFDQFATLAEIREKQCKSRISVPNIHEARVAHFGRESDNYARGQVLQVRSLSDIALQGKKGRSQAIARFQGECDVGGNWLDLKNFTTNDHYISVICGDFESGELEPSWWRRNCDLALLITSV